MAQSKCVVNQSFGATPEVGRTRPASSGRDALIVRGINYVTFKCLDIGHTIDDLPPFFIYAGPSPAHRHRSRVRCEMVQRSASSFWLKQVGFIIADLLPGLSSFRS